MMRQWLGLQFFKSQIFGEILTKL